VCLRLYPDQAGKGTATTPWDHMMYMCMERPPKLTGAKRLGQGRFTLAQQPSRCAVFLKKK
jgi:hypothetical protein